MKRIVYLSLTMLVIGVISMGFISNTPAYQQEKHPDVDWSISCNECHAEMTPEVFKAWENSSHGQVNFGCYICHGDGQEEFHAKGQDDGCQGCHAQQLVDFEKVKAESCFDCHDGHSLKFHNSN